MKRLLNTLYVTTQDSYLARSGETVVVRVEREPKLRVPIHNLGSIVCFGRIGCSPSLMAMCAERQVPISFLSQHGRFQARVTGPVSGNVLLHREQYRQADDANLSARIARGIVIAKIMNCRVVLRRALRDHPDSKHATEIKSVSEKLGRAVRNIDNNPRLDVVRGTEGEAARAYFSVFDALVVAQRDAFRFKQRSRRPPLDNMNALLSFLYVLLQHDIIAALETNGLDPAVGFLHRDRPGRPSLALDLMEEFRPYLADRLALSLVNRRQVNPSGFRKTDSGAIYMDDKTRKTVLVAYQQRKSEEIRHPFLSERVSIGLLPHIQATLMSRYLRDDLDEYPPFLWR